MLLFYQIFNVVLFAILNALAMWSLKGRKQEIENVSPFKYPDYVYYGIVMLEVFIIYVVAGFVAGVSCLAVGCFL